MQFASWSDAAAVWDLLDIPSISISRFQMMLNMSKMMRRVRGRKMADEEGEVMSDDDDDVEEGQIMQEKGDDVELIEGLQPNGT